MTKRFVLQQHAPQKGSFYDKVGLGRGLGTYFGPWGCTAKRSWNLLGSLGPYCREVLEPTVASAGQNADPVAWNTTPVAWNTTPVAWNTTRWLGIQPWWPRTQPLQPGIKCTAPVAWNKTPVAWYTMPVAWHTTPCSLEYTHCGHCDALAVNRQCIESTPWTPSAANNIQIPH